MTKGHLFTHPLHLGLGATAVPQPEMAGGPDWYAAYEARVAGDGAEGRLVTLFTFDADWNSWEMHPAGDEAVICVEGEITLHQEMADGTTAQVTLGRGDFAINPPGCWHTADVPRAATVLFITAGAGTEVKPR